MDPITSTIISLVCLMASFYIGKSSGKREGIELGIIILTEFFTKKLGVEKMQEYENEFVDMMRRKHGS